MPDRLCDLVTLTGGHLTIHDDVKLSALTMPHPADRNVVDLHHTLGLCGDA